MAQEQPPLDLPGVEPRPLPARFTIAEAAAVTGKSTDQIRRAVKGDPKAGKRPRLASSKDPAGVYSITAEALIAAGFELRNAPLALPLAPASERQGVELEAARRRISELEADKAALLAMQEKLLDSFQALTRALAPGDLASGNTNIASAPLANATRRHWWQKSAT